MTTKEMVILHSEGMSFQKIADICGVSKQAVHQRVSTYCEDKICKRGRQFNVSKIKYKGLYEHFVNNPNETVTSLTIKIYGHRGKHVAVIRTLLLGTNSTLPLNAFKKICEIVGKPFEEVFEERDVEKGE
jgi:predicted DNA-binding protein YlxM (UPF0122 family)